MQASYPILCESSPSEVQLEVQLETSLSSEALNLLHIPHKIFSLQGREAE
jgi:hypothetical protein